MQKSWSLYCSDCDNTRDAEGLPTVCDVCGLPWLVKYHAPPTPEAKRHLAERDWNMWRYREWLPLVGDETPVSLGEGMTPLVRVSSVEQSLGLDTVWMKDEGQNPCGSFKARGLSAAVIKAVAAGAEAFTIPTAGNAGVALSAYASQAGKTAKVFAPKSTPDTIVRQMRLFGGDVELLDGHIGDCGQASRAYAAEVGATDVSTLKEPYRIEGKKTMGLELAEQFDWTLPDCILYPTGGGTGLIGMWKVFHELIDAGWLQGPVPRMFSVQTTGCAPVVRAFQSGADKTEPWEDPWTVASGLRVPGPIGGKIILSAIRETSGSAIAISDEELTRVADRVAADEGIDVCPEGGAAVAALEHLVRDGIISANESVVVFNTGAGWLYR